MKKRPMSAEEIRRMTEELKEICKPGDRVELISPVDDPFLFAKLSYMDLLVENSGVRVIIEKQPRRFLGNILLY